MLRAELDAAGGDITQTPRFREWFGDSKIADEQGAPTVVYHGSGADLTETDFAFRDDLIGTRTDEGHFGRGFYFARSSGEAGYYGPNVGAFYLAIDNPLVLDNTTGDLTMLGSFLSWAPKLDAIGALDPEQRQALDSIQRAKAYVEENVEYVPAQNFDGTDGFSAKVEYYETDGAEPYGPLTAEARLGPRGFAQTKEEALERLLREFLQTAETSLSDQYPGIGNAHASLSDYVRTDLGSSALSDAAKAAGHDGIVFGDEIIAFRPEQIKSQNEPRDVRPDGSQDPGAVIGLSGVLRRQQDCR